jgi:hypothetical protein
MRPPPPRHHTHIHLHSPSRGRHLLRKEKHHCKRRGRLREQEAAKGGPASTPL